MDLNNFINGMGAAVEMWLLLYKNFMQHGLTEKEALMHTQAMFTATLAGNKNNDSKGEATI